MDWMIAFRAVEADLRLLLLPGSAAEVGGLAGRWSVGGLTVRVVRGRKMSTTTRLFDEFAAAFQFPSYFGENWDAFDECLADLNWLPFGAGYVVVITESEQVLVDANPHELEIFVGVLKAAAETYRDPISLGETWDRPAVPFHVVLAGDVGTPAVIQRWQDAGMQLAAAPRGE
jgi:RNAse (barnase) inhibitor barstar